MQPPHWQRAFIGVGANLDDPESGVRRAIASLRCVSGVKLVTCSSLYRTAPVGYLDQPEFVNAVVALETTLDPPEAHLQDSIKLSYPLESGLHFLYVEDVHLKYVLASPILVYQD